MKEKILVFVLFQGLCLTLTNAQIIKDIDGNIYKTVTIGSQIWMAENLRTTKYNDGTIVPLVADEILWATPSTAGFCWYNNDENAYREGYGALYNWYAIDSVSNGGKNVCPAGWHIPTRSQWSVLTGWLANSGYGFGGSGSDIAKAMASTSGWSASTTEGNIGNDQGSNNKSGLTGLPGGYRDFDATFDTHGGYCGWWSSSGYDSDYAWSIVLIYCNSEASAYENGKKMGFSVRCIRDYQVSGSHSHSGL